MLRARCCIRSLTCTRAAPRHSLSQMRSSARRRLARAGLRVRHQERLLRQPALRGRPSDQGAHRFPDGRARARARAVLRDHRPRSQRASHGRADDRSNCRSRERTNRYPHGPSNDDANRCADRVAILTPHHRAFLIPHGVSNLIADVKPHNTTDLLAYLIPHGVSNLSADVPHLLHFPGRSQLRRSSSMSVG